MSEDEKVQSEVPASNKPQASDIECGVCGLDGGPVVECAVCNGQPRYAQKRHFTLTEERRGLNDEEREKRYGRYGEVGPTVIDLPGSFNPFSPKTNK